MNHSETGRKADTTPTWTPPPPGRVPALHQDLLAWTAGPVAHAITEHSHARDMGTIVPIAPTARESARIVHDEECRRLRDAHLFAVDGPMTAQAIAAGSRLPDWSLEPADLPCEQGFVVYDTPIGHSPTTTVPLPIVACSWGPSPYCSPSSGAVWVTFWAAVPPRLPGPLMWHDEALLPWSAPPPELPDEPTTIIRQVDDIPGVIANKRTLPWLRTMIATWLLIQQPTVTEVTEHHAPRPDRRRAQRDGRTLPPVRVVGIHRRVHPDRSAGAPSGRHVGVRFPVEGFWRRQPYGPDLALRRRQWIHDHWRGPHDAPLLVRPKVNHVTSPPDQA